MIRDLPKQVPTIVLAVADRVIKERERFENNRSVAISAFRAHELLDRDLSAETTAELETRAEAICDWGVNVREALPIVRLYRWFKTDAPPALTVVNHQITLKPVGSAPGGTLKMRLDLELDPDRDVLFRHHEWFDGYRVAGGGVMNTGTSLLMSLHSEMLRQVHDLIAENQIWERATNDFTRLLESFKDR